VFLNKNGLKVLLELLHNDVWMVEAVKSMHCLVKSFPVQSRSHSLSCKMDIDQDYKPWFNREEVSDIKFIVENRIVFASKFILVARSEYFKKLFLVGMRESRQTEIPIQDVSYDIFYKLMEFLHTSGIDITNSHEAVQLLMAADRFQLHKLKVRAEGYLFQEVNEETVIHFYSMAVSFNADGLKRFCLDWILSNCCGLLVGNSGGIQLLKEILQLEGLIEELHHNIVDFFTDPLPEKE